MNWQSQSFKNSLLIGLLIFIAIVSSSYVLYISALKAIESDIEEYLKGIATAVVQEIDGDQHLKFTSRDQESTKEYQAAIAKLAAVQKLFPGIKYVYTILPKGGKVHFILDPTPPGTFMENGMEVKAHIMQEYEDAEKIPALMQAIKHQKPAFNKEPYTDSWGSFVSAYMPIYTNNGDFAGIVGVDIDAKDYAGKLNRIYRAEIICIIIGFGISLLISYLLYKKGNALESTLTKLKRANLRVEATARDLQESLTKAEEANLTKSDFLANMSHELRTPMNGVLGMADLLSDTNLTKEQKEFVNTIKFSAEGLLILLNDILDISKIEADALILENVVFKPKEIISKTVDLLGMQAKKKNVAIRLNCEALPDYAFGDPGRFRQVITNLLSNAVKFTEVGHISLHAKRNEQQDREKMHIIIEDTGAGIPSDKLDKIFDKFTQADASITRKYGGTGLGLAITKKLVALMGGDIGVESAEGKGSTFWFTVIMKQATEEAYFKQNQLYISRPKAVEVLKPAKEAVVLLAEDYSVNQVFAVKILQKLGIRNVDVAENGLIALQKLKDKRYDLIFMDCQMPEMDGYQAAMKIRINEKDKGYHTTIVAMTANAMLGDREKCLKAGMDDYLSKPLKIADLRNLLQAYFLLEESFSAQTKDIPGNSQGPIDLCQLHDFTNGDIREEVELISLFLEQAKYMLAILAQSINPGNEDNWKSASHRLKGASANLGAVKLQNICSEAELNYKSNLEYKSEYIQKISAEIEKIESYLIEIQTNS